ncbi:MAG: hypothetical protein AAF975_01255 [Spirochaetota bacterium]
MLRAFIRTLPLLILSFFSDRRPVLGAQSEDALSPVVAEQRSPNWLLLEQGKIFYRQGDYGEALRKFLLAKRSSVYAPEANYLIGRIFDVDNNLALAVSQIKEAMAQRQFLYDPNEIYDLLTVLGNLYYRKQEYYQYEATMLKAIAMELPTTTESLRKGRQIRDMLQRQGIDEVLYYYDESFSHIVPALNELSLYYYKEAYYNDSLRLSLYSIISTLSQGIAYLREQQYIPRIPRNTAELYDINPEYVISKLSADLASAGIDYAFRWNLDDLSLEEPETQLLEIIAKIREVDPIYNFSLLGYYLNTLKQYPVTQELLQENHLYRQLYFMASALSIQGHMDSSNGILNALNYLPQAGEWRLRAQSQLRQSFIDRQIPLGIYLPD